MYTNLLASLDSCTAYSSSMWVDWYSFLITKKTLMKTWWYLLSATIPKMFSYLIDYFKVSRPSFQLFCIFIIYCECWERQCTYRAATQEKIDPAGFNPRVSQCTHTVTPEVTVWLGLGITIHFPRELANPLLVPWITVYKVNRQQQQSVNSLTKSDSTFWAPLLEFKFEELPLKHFGLTYPCQSNCWVLMQLKGPWHS